MPCAQCGGWGHHSHRQTPLIVASGSPFKAMDGVRVWGLSVSAWVRTYMHVVSGGLWTRCPRPQGWFSPQGSAALSPGLRGPFPCYLPEGVE